MSESAAFRRALLGEPGAKDGDAVRPVPPGGAALHAASPIAYVPDAVLAVLATGVAAAHDVSLWIAAPVLLVLGVVLVALRAVRQVAGAGGDVALVRAELGSRAAMMTAAALLVDHVLLVSLSVTAAAHLLTAAVPGWLGRELGVALVLLLALCVAQLGWGSRVGRRTADRVLWVTVWCYAGGLSVVVLVGTVRVLFGTLSVDPARAPVAADHLAAATPDLAGATGALTVTVIIARAVSACSVALAGVTTTGAGPRGRRRRGLLTGRGFFVLGLGAAAGVLGLLALAGATLARPPSVSGRDRIPTVVAQVAVDVLGPVAAAVVIVVLAVGLLLAALAALRQIPDVRPALLGRDTFPGESVAPRTATLAVGAGAATVIAVAGASIVALVPMYVVAVFTLLALGQVAGTRRWRRRMEWRTQPRARSLARRSGVVTTVGAALTLLVLVLTLVGGAQHGSWLAMVAIGAIFAMMLGVSRHRRAIEAQLALEHLPEDRPLPAAVRAVVVVTRFDRVTMRAVAYARASRTGTVEAVTVPLGAPESAELRRQWLAAELPIPLVELAAPRGDRASAVTEYVRSVHREHPRGLIAVYLPEVVADRGWRGWLLGGARRRLRRQLLMLPRTTVTTVPWRLHHGAGAATTATVTVTEEN